MTYRKGVSGGMFLATICGIVFAMLVSLFASEYQKMARKAMQEKEMVATQPVAAQPVVRSVTQPAAVMVDLPVQLESVKQYRQIDRSGREYEVTVYPSPDGGCVITVRAQSADIKGEKE